MIGERLLRARAAAGLSMKALGDLVGVSANMIKKYEHNQNMPSSGVMIKLAKVLSVRSEYFFRPVKVELAGVEFRKRANTPASVLKKLEADVLDQAERWQELANLWPTFPVPKFSVPQNLPGKITSLDEIETFANQVRSAWDLGGKPVLDLIDVLESQGILVIITQVDESAKFDGLQATVADQPVIVLSANWPGDRQRFTLAHELGHLLLHGRLSAELNEEKACNRFAGSFLLPANAIRQQLGITRHTIEFRELFFLKHEFGLSMRACLYRACDLGIITESIHKLLSMQFSYRGWRKCEPGRVYPQEETLLFQQLIYRGLGENILSESKAAELLGISLMTFHRQRKLELVDAAINQ